MNVASPRGRRGVAMNLEVSPGATVLCRPSEGRKA
jgi:hypothetical protein